jgi:hypothetical protein
MRRCGNVYGNWSGQSVQEAGAHALCVHHIQQVSVHFLIHAANIIGATADMSMVYFFELNRRYRDISASTMS